MAFAEPFWDSLAALFPNRDWRTDPVRWDVISTWDEPHRQNTANAALLEEIFGAVRAARDGHCNGKNALHLCAALCSLISEQQQEFEAEKSAAAAASAAAQASDANATAPTGSESTWASAAKRLGVTASLLCYLVMATKHLSETGHTTVGGHTVTAAYAALEVRHQGLRKLQTLKPERASFTLKKIMATAAVESFANPLPHGRGDSSPMRASAAAAHSAAFGEPLSPSCCAAPSPTATLDPLQPLSLREA